MIRSIVVMIDNREHDLWRALTTTTTTSTNSSGLMGGTSLLRTTIQKQQPPVVLLPISKENVLEKTTLAVGDIWIMARKLYPGGAKEDAILAVVERKTTNDLWASIKDGRYHDQDHRVMEFCNAAALAMTGDQKELPKQEVLYIKVIEGACPKNVQGVSALSQMSHATFFGVCDPSIMSEKRKQKTSSVIRTMSVSETVLYLDALYEYCRKKFVDESEKHMEEPSAQEALWRSLSFSKEVTKHARAAKRSDHIGPSLILAGALSMVPRMGFGTAESISALFGGCIATFIQEGLQDNVAWRNKILGAMKRPSPRLVDEIRRLFF